MATPHKAMRDAWENNCTGAYSLMLELLQQMEEKYHIRRLRLES